MKRMMIALSNEHSGQPSIPAYALLPWSDANEITLPQAPSAEWPASLLLDYAIDRVVRDAIGSGGSMQEALAHLAELAQSLVPHLTEAELDQRVHAQLIANT